MTRKRTAPPATPGDMLREWLGELEMSQEAFAQHIGTTFTTISKIINGHSRITPRMACKFGAALRTSAYFWLNAQTATDIWRLEQKGEKLPKPLFQTKNETPRPVTNDDT